MATCQWEHFDTNTCKSGNDHGGDNNSGSSEVRTAAVGTGNSGGSVIIILPSLVSIPSILFDAMQ